MTPKKGVRKSAHLLLYSTNTLLSYRIAQRYFADMHYVWCTPYFSLSNAPNHVELPPTSCPSIIYHRLWEEVRAGDKHSSHIESNRHGNIRAAQAKKLAGIISAEQHQEIVEIVQAAEVADFRPLLYLIPCVGVKKLMEDVPVSERAHPLSTEYRIVALPRSLFDVIELREK